MGEWSNLTQREKSNIIRFAIKNGVSDINTIRDTFNVYANGIENEYKEGGSIHIKHPGRLTALKERTGKTEAELWATGNAHTRKMITFARNARKWKHSTGGPLYPFSFQKNPYWKIPVVRYEDGGDINREFEFLPNENIQNIEVWLNKGTRFQKQRPGTVNLQNIVEALNPNGPDNQYVWDNAEHTSYSAFRRNPDYRAPVIPAINKDTFPIGLNISRYIEKAPGVNLSSEYILNNLPNFKFPPITVSLPKNSKQNLKGNWIQTGASWNPAYGYETFHLENSPYYGIKYYSIPGTVNAGQGSSAVLDSTVMGIPIQELNERIFDYRTNNGGFNSFSDIN